MSQHFVGRRRRRYYEYHVHMQMYVTKNEKCTNGNLHLRITMADLNIQTTVRRGSSDPLLHPCLRQAETDHELRVPGAPV